MHAMVDRIATAGEAVFDRMASEYDAIFSDTLLGRLLREAVRKRTLPWVESASSVLEIGCGTGLDATWMAGLGKRVTAIDPSAAMIEQSRARIALAGLSDRVVLHRQSLEGFLEEATGDFDLVFSNFGALNCVDRLGQRLRDLSKVQRAGGVAALVLMNRDCVWEQLWHIAHGRPRDAFRRRRPASFEVGGARMAVYYPGVAKLLRDAGASYECIAQFGIGVLLPPTYLSDIVARWPGISARVAAAEWRIASLAPFRTLGDHVLLLLRRTR
jgi:SAM-dependent methyltransferase